MSQTRILIIGATGMVGGLALRFALDSPDVSAVTVIGRRPVDLTHPRLSQVRHADFGNYAAVSGALANQDIALFCLGTYTSSVSDAELRRVTVDYTSAFAEALHARSPGAVVCFLSGQGADRREKSRVAFARYKGAAENALLAVGFRRVYIFRPGYIYPTTPRREPNFGYRVLRVLYPVARLMYPNIGIASDDLARATVHAGLHGLAGHGDVVLEHHTIRALAAEDRPRASR